MAEFPAMPLWTDAYLADTRHLSAAEHGAYLLLMMEAWRRPSCSLPDDDGLLSRLACMSHNEWGAAKGNVMAFWTLDAKTKTWRQKRLSKEHAFLSEKRKKNRQNSAKRWNKKENDDANGYPNDMPKASQPTPTPTPLKKEPSVSKKGTRIPADFQPDLDAAVTLGLRPEVAMVEAAKFKDYWIAASGAKGVKADWPATWRNWVRSALQRQGARGSPGGKSAYRQHQDDVKRELENFLDGKRTQPEDSEPFLDLGREDFFRD